MMNKLTSRQLARRPLSPHFSLPKGNRMPTNRSPISRTQRRLITAEHVRLFQRCHAIRRDRDDLYWEPDGKRGEYIELATQLHRLLGLKSWQTNVLDAGSKPVETDARVLA